MLSSRTRDKVTFEAMERLKSHDCSVDRILEMSDEELGKLIKPVAFWQVSYSKSCLFILICLKLS